MEAAAKSTFLYSSNLSSSSSDPRLGFSSRIRVRTLAAQSDQWDYSGRLVNESLVVLRKRVHEMKMVERNYEPPSTWMDWEKQCYAEYDESICQFVGFVQFCLMNTRPSLALALLTLTVISVPFSTVVILSRAMETANGALSTLHFY